MPVQALQCVQSGGWSAAFACPENIVGIGPVLPLYRAHSSSAWIVRLLLTLCSWWIAAGTASAGFISTPSLNAIYGQAAFGLKPITVNWLTPGASIISPRLATINDDIEVRDLFALAPSASPVVNVFFVDAIGFCGGLFSSGIVGCSSQPGNNLMVEIGRAHV